MRGWMKVLLLATVLAVAAAACGRIPGLTEPGAGSGPSADVVPMPGDGDGVSQDEPPPTSAADTTGRWGGGLGSGT